MSNGQHCPRGLFVSVKLSCILSCQIQQPLITCGHWASEMWLVCLKRCFSFYLPIKCDSWQTNWCHGFNHQILHWIGENKNFLPKLLRGRNSVGGWRKYKPELEWKKWADDIWNKTASYLFVRGGFWGVTGMKGCTWRFCTEGWGTAWRWRLEHSKERNNTVRNRGTGWVPTCGEGQRREEKATHN